MSSLQSLYAQHLDTVAQRHDEALDAAGLSGVVIHSGELRYQFQDDRPYPFAANPNFLYWAPLVEHPDCWIIYRPGRTPTLVYFQPDDYWHLPPADPAGYWVEHFELVVAKTREQGLAALPAERSGLGFLGESTGLARELGFNAINPDALLRPLHYRRAFKTAYEVACMGQASRLGAKAHDAAREAFEAGEAEYGIHLAYLEAIEATDEELPYGSIVALNEHAAVLHYQALDRRPPERIRSFLIDAGARAAGYCSDITRTYSTDPEDDFAALVTAMDERQRQLVAACTAGVDFRSLHLAAHRHVAELLADFGIVRASADAVEARGLTRLFLPHGLGHLLGLQVHEVAGHQADPGGGERERPEGHPNLRLTRTLEPGMATTIEPGLYFIPALLNPLRNQPEGNSIDWERVEQFVPYGGVRIEDDVVVTDAAPRNLTREAFAALT